MLTIACALLIAQQKPREEGRITYVEGTVYVSDRKGSTPRPVTGKSLVGGAHVPLTKRSVVVMGEGSFLVGCYGLYWLRINGPYTFVAEKWRSATGAFAPKIFRDEQGMGPGKPVVFRETFGLLGVEKRARAIELPEDGRLSLAWFAPAGVTSVSITPTVEGHPLKEIVFPASVPESGDAHIGWIDNAVVGEAIREKLVKASARTFKLTVKPNVGAAVTYDVTIPVTEDSAKRSRLLERARIAFSADSWLENVECIDDWVSALYAVQDRFPVTQAYLASRAWSKLPGYELTRGALRSVLKSGGIAGSLFLNLK